MSVKEKEHDFLVKILLIGDSGVGAKTTLLDRFVNDRFDTSIPTIGVDFKHKMVDIDGMRVKLQIWDTAGQERFREITGVYYRGKNVIVLGYDITDKQSFEISRWKADIERFASPDAHMNVVLVGNKCDVSDEKRKITFGQGKQVADENGWLFFETSAKENINVTETFLAAAQMGLHQVQFGSSVCCRKFDPAAVFGPRWEVIWAKLHPSMLALGKTKEQALDIKIASTFAMSGSKCKIIDEHKGSRHILVFTPASDEKIQKLYFSFDDSGARDTFSKGIAFQKYRRLLSAVPSSNYDCSDMCSPQHLLSVIKRASFQDSAAVVETLSIAGNHLRPQDVAELMEELHKFPALTCLDVSANPELGVVGVVAVMSSLSGSKSHLLSSLNLSGTGLTLEAVPMMLEQLDKFSVLKQLDISDNPGLRLLSVGMLQFATRLDTLACDGFSPNLFSTPGENPGRIRHLLRTPPDAMVQDETDWEVNFAAAELTPALTQEAAIVLRLCPSLNLLDLSANVKLGSGGVCDILSSLKGTQASSLRQLKLSRTSLQVEGVSKLAEQLQMFPKLRVLDLSGNPGLDRASISLLIDALQATCEFVELDLSGSSVETLPENISRRLPKLAKFILDDCSSLNSLPVTLGSLKDLKHISVKRCAALVNPPRSQQLDPIKTAKFMTSAYSNNEHWRRVKVAFLGNGRSGKTSLLRTLAKMPLQTDERSTTGITVDAFAAELQPNVFDRARHGWDLELSWWDFAGQLEYSAAHEFFMSLRQALYVVVFSVLDEDEVIMQQLLHWFSVVPALAACPHVRLMVVGTKIDQIPSSELQSVLKIKRKIVHHILDIMGLAERVLPLDILFVSASLAFDCPEQKLSWKLCRRGLKDRIYHNCVGILDGDNSDVLRYPKQCKQMRQLVSQLHKELNKKQHGFPCCKLDNEDAVKVLGSLLEETDFWGQRKSSLETHDRKLYFKTDLVALALDILNDLGIIVLYGGQGIRPSLASAQSEPSICVEPQFLPAIMSLLVDPQTKLPAVVTSDALLDLLETNPKISRISRESSPELKAQLLELLESVGIVRRRGSSQNFLVPLALRGRPVHWSQIVRAGCSEYFVLRGQRLGHTARITTACFMSVMLNKCVDVGRMWGSAFAYDVNHEAGHVIGCVFVRLAEDRRSVDVVALIDVAVDIDWQVVMQREVDSIAQLLGNNFHDANDRMYLCPMCCSANMFVHSGAAHAFYLQEVSSGVALHCSRYHDVTDYSLTEGKIVKLDLNGTPLLHPSRIQELQLPWKLAAAGGITVPQMCNAPVSEADSNHGYHCGTFLDTSFFVLTGQVVAGAVLQSDDLLRFESLITSCNDQCAPFPPFSDRFVLKDSVEVQLQFRFNVGDMPALPGGRKIISIHASDVGDALDTTPSMGSFSCMDNVLVIFEKFAREKKQEFVLFPGKRRDLHLCRLTPAYCSINTQAACCWSELQDYFAVVMGPEFQNYEVAALTLFRNDDRAHAFLQQIHTMTWCKRDAVAPWQNRGRIAADAIATLLGDAFASYREKFEQEFDWLHYRTMEDDELKHEMQQKYSVDKSHADEVVAVVRQLLYTFDAQDATMHHFADHAGKFGFVPPEENVDVNLTLGWWGHWKGNAVYELLAQNGFTNIPKQLKIDEGYYGKGFYFTRFPRYSDYYNCGFSLATREVEGTFLMSFTLMGRPYPVIQHPHPKPSTGHQRALHAQADALDNGLLGRSCDEQPHRCCGPDSHDSHYVTVKKKGDYYPCPPREQPDFDEVVVFNPTNVLPAASFEFKRRRRTLLWLDDHPDRNMAVLKQFPGCPQHKSMLHQPVYPMRPHCLKCGHGLSMDSNPFATCKERKKMAEAAKQAYTAAVIAAEDTPSDEATRKEAECKRAIDEVIMLVEEAEAVANAMHEALKGRDIKLEEQVDVVMFLRVEELADFMSKHPELSNYPTSLLRIISSHSLFFGDTVKGAAGLLHFLDSEPAWRFKFPATFVYFKYPAADFSAAMGRPNFFKSREPNHCSAFASFKPLALMPK